MDPNPYIHILKLNHHFMPGDMRWIEIFVSCDVCGDYGKHWMNFRRSRKMDDYGHCRARWLKGKSIRSCSEEATRVIVAVDEQYFGKTDKQLKQRGFIVPVCDQCPKHEPFGIANGLGTKDKYCP